MKSKKNKTPVTGVSWRIARRVCEQVASSYPYLAAGYLLCLLLSDLTKAWSRFFNWPAMDVMLAAFSLAALVGRPGASPASARSFYGKTLVAAAFVAAGLLSHIDPYSFLILLFGIGAVVYRRIDPKFALLAGTILLASAPVLTAFGKEHLSISVTVCAFYFFAILVFASMAALADGRRSSVVRKLPPA